MAQKPEAKYKGKVHRKLPSYIYHQGMYTPYSSGTPDHWFSGPERDLWVEYKWVDPIPKILYIANPEVKYPILTHKQQQWLNGRYNEGRNVAVVCASHEGAVIMKHRRWMHSIEKEVFLHFAQPAEEIAHWIMEEVSIKSINKNQIKNLPI